MVEGRGVEPHPTLYENLVFKASRHTNAPALPSIIGIPPGIRTPSHGFGDRHAAVNTSEIYLVPPPGIEPGSDALQAPAMTTSAKAAIRCLASKKSMLSRKPQLIITRVSSPAYAE